MTKTKKRKIVPITSSLLFILFVLSLYDSNSRIVTESFQLFYKKLPPAFDGFKIVHLSDMHAKRYGKNDERLLSAVRGAKPNIIVITGDMFEKNGQLGIVKPQLEALLEIAPVYYVSGNHEWATGDMYKCFDMLKEIGVKALRNEFERIWVGGSYIVLAGVDDENGPYDQKKPHQLMAEIQAEDSDAYTILLAHRPEHFPKYADLGFDTVLSGHIHGGMLRLPVLGGIFGPGRDILPEYPLGLYSDGESDLLVSGGLAGVFSIPRVFNPGHIPVLTLRRED